MNETEITTPLRMIPIPQRKCIRFTLGYQRQLLRNKSRIHNGKY
jgi:hypothetical protein